MLQLLHVYVGAVPEHAAEELAAAEEDGLQLLALQVWRVQPATAAVWQQQQGKYGSN